MLFHEHAHDSEATEKRGNTIITRGLRIRSDRLRVSGTCDVVEFHSSKEGITLSGYEGTWQPYPIEYKKGKEKPDQADELQLCGQAICLEEMLLCKIPCGSLFYGEIRRRVSVDFTDELREQVKAMLTEMHELWDRGYTPKVKAHKGCNACSLKEICIPRLGRTKTVKSYIDTRLTGE
jgi:CRISPR-associated exonuclease Cas4